MADETTTETEDTTEGGQSTEATTEGATSNDGADEAQLGDAGKKALSEERTARKAAETKAKELEAEVSRLRRSNAATKGTDLDAIKAEISAEYDAKILASEIKAEAKGRLTDAGDVSRYPEYFEGVKAGDDDAIKAAVDKLIKEKPYLAAVAVADPKKGWGDVGGTQRKGSDPEPATPIERLRRSYSN